MLNEVSQTRKDKYSLTALASKFTERKLNRRHQRRRGEFHEGRFVEGW